MSVRERTDKRMGPVGKVLTVLLGLPILLFFNVVVLAALGSAQVYVFQVATGTVKHGVVTEADGVTVHGRRGPDEHYCFGYLTVDGSGRQLLVRIYSEECWSAKDLPATVLPGVGSPLSAVIDGDHPDPYDGVAFNGLYGMTSGALVDPRPFWVGLWPFLFLAPFAVGMDLALVAVLRRRKPSHRRDRE